jgi:DNA mismatch endonuclease, patch repair protein
MTDIVDKVTRSRMMAGIGPKNTKPELMIRRELHRLGYRYRLHYSQLPGKPDLVLPKHRVIILINGCFWHGHQCHLFKWPSTRPEFWKNKIGRTVIRDAENLEKYANSEWRVLTIWECALKGKNRLESPELIARVSDWIKGTYGRSEIVGGEKAQQ